VAQPQGPGRVSATATLSILTAPAAVQRVPAGAATPAPAKDGMSLAVGDRVLTGPGATALITFLDGSTVTVQPGSDVTVTKADVGKTSAAISVRISLGTVWARVARLADPASRLSLEANTASATVHDGLIGGQQNADGSFVCWTQSPGMAVVDNGGLEMMRVEPGQRVTLKPGEKPSVATFRVNLSALRVTVPPGVLPLVFMPDRARVAGFVAPGIEVNQVFGSKTSQAADGARALEVPAGLAGSYLLVLEGEREGPDYVSWAVFVEGVPVHQETMPVRLIKGGRLTTQISVTIDPATSKEPRTARATAATAKPLVKFEGPLPGRILLAPAELERAAQR
jgi:preprotein translocase subunit YajC